MQSALGLPLGHIIVILLWLFLAGSFFFPLYDWASGPTARLAFWGMLAAHAVECAVFLPVLRVDFEVVEGFEPSRRGEGGFGSSGRG